MTPWSVMAMAGHPLLGRPADQVADARGPVQQRELRVVVQMDEAVATHQPAARRYSLASMADTEPRAEGGRPRTVWKPWGRTLDKLTVL